MIKYLFSFCFQFDCTTGSVFSRRLFGTDKLVQSLQDFGGEVVWFKIVRRAVAGPEMSGCHLLWTGIDP